MAASDQNTAFLYIPSILCYINQKVKNLPNPYYYKKWRRMEHMHFLFEVYQYKITDLTGKEREHVCKK